MRLEGDALSQGSFLKQYRQKAAAFAKAMENLCFGLTPSAVYFNPTERRHLGFGHEGGRPEWWRTRKA